MRDFTSERSDVKSAETHREKRIVVLGRPTHTCGPSSIRIPTPDPADGGRVPDELGVVVPLRGGAVRRRLPGQTRRDAVGIEGRTNEGTRWSLVKGGAAAHMCGGQSGRGGTPPLPHHEACRLLALRGFRNSAPFVQRVLGFFSRRIRFGTLRPYLGTPLRRLLSPSFHGFPLHFSCPSSVRSKSLNGLRIPPFAALWRLLWLLLTSPRPYASLL